MKTLTIKQLRTLGACRSTVALLAGTFGDAAQVTEANCLKVADKVDWDWAAEHLLTAPAWAEYQRVRDAAWAVYERVRDAAWAEYQRVRDAAWAEYRRVKAHTFALLYAKEK
jgi:hypothetical protein